MYTSADIPPWQQWFQAGNCSYSWVAAIIRGETQKCKKARKCSSVCRYMIFNASLITLLCISTTFPIIKQQHQQQRIFVVFFFFLSLCVCDFCLCLCEWEGELVKRGSQSSCQTDSHSSLLCNSLISLPSEGVNTCTHTHTLTPRCAHHADFQHDRMHISAHTNSGVRRYWGLL